LLLWPDAQVAVRPQSRVAPTLEQTIAATPDDFTICTYNLHGLGRGSEQYTVPQEYDQQLAKRARTIAESLQGCTIIGLQETGTPADAEGLAALLRNSFALDYAAVSLAGPNTASLEFPLTNSLLVRRERVQVLASRLPQSCSPQDYEAFVIPGDCPPGEYALFDRPPLVVELAVSGAWGEPFTITVIVNHWKSKGGDERINVVRRTAQARHVATLVQAMLDADPAAHVVVLGDLNDYYQSGPVEALRTGVEPPLLHLYDYLPAGDRYSYIYNGASQVLDHLLVTPGLAPYIALVDPVRINANYSAGAADQVANLARSSDHDPVALLIRPQGAVILAGNLDYPEVSVQLTDKDRKKLLTTTTDAQGEFRFWDLPAGDYHLTMFAPNYLAPTSVQATFAQSTTLTAGYHIWHAPKLTQQTTTVGLTTMLVGPALLDQTRQQVTR
jgi:endonuclease/exonuclease/phosphatase family metal-dependent hydrolase